MGQHTNDLFTNQNYVGRPANETYLREVIKLQFYDKEGNIITPTKIKVNNTTEGGLGYYVTNIVSTHTIGQTNARANFGGRMSIQNGQLIIQGNTNNEAEISSIFYFKILSLETEEKTYTYFEYR